MKINSKASKLLFSVLCLSSLEGYTAEASIVKIVNNSEENIKAEIIASPEGSPYCWKCVNTYPQICGQQNVEVVVPKNAFCGYEYFSVVDTGGGLLARGQCKNLSLLKDYEVSFSNTFLGTECKAKEI